MNYDNIKLKKIKHEYKIGEIIKYKCYDKKRVGLFYERINDNEITLILINNKFNEGLKININTNQILF